MIQKLSCIFILLSLISCASDDEDSKFTLDGQIEEFTTLQEYVNDRIIDRGAVIGCAGSAIDSNAILAFYYNEEGSTDHRFYETESVNVVNDDFSNYTRINLEITPFMNDALGMFTRVSGDEKWIILTYELEGEIKLSNPIRSKQNIQPTVYTEEVMIDQSTQAMPIFEWRDDPFDENAIYFQIVSDNQNNLLSGTYTFENRFQYYDISNVVLNITKGIPPNLELGVDYNFTLMDVSEDSWVNFLTLNQNFLVE